MSLTPEGKYASEAIKKGGTEWNNLLENFSHPDVPVEALQELQEAVATSVREAILGNIEQARQRIQAALTAERLNAQRKDAEAERGRVSKLLGKIFGDVSSAGSFQASPESVEALEMARKIEQLYSFLNIQISLRQSRILRVSRGEEINLPEDDKFKAALIAGCEKHKDETDAAVKQGLLNHMRAFSVDVRLETGEAEIGGEMVPLIRELNFGFQLPKDIFKPIKELTAGLKWEGGEDFEKYQVRVGHYQSITDVVSNWVRERYGLYGGFTQYEGNDVLQVVNIQSRDALRTLEHIMSRPETSQMFTTDEVANMRRTFLRYQAEFDAAARRGAYVRH